MRIEALGFYTKSGRHVLCLTQNLWRNIFADVGSPDQHEIKTLERHYGEGKAVVGPFTPYILHLSILFCIFLRLLTIYSLLKLFTMKTKFYVTKISLYMLALTSFTFRSIAQNTKYGIGALFSNTTGIHNSAFGYQSLYSNTGGTDNTGLGHFSLFSNQSGHFNTATGSYTLYSNTTGSGNTGNGHQALRSNTTGLGNTAIGAEAMYFNVSGNNNTAVGENALTSNTSGNENTANGVLALAHNTTANSNTAIGSFTLSNNTTGSYNTATGSFALISNRSGYYNTATGNEALSDNRSGYNNTAQGYRALFKNKIGNSNTAIGVKAGANVTEGSNNTFIGYNADCGPLGKLRNATAIGHDALVMANSTVHIGNTSVTSIGGYVNWSNISDGRFKKNIKDNIKGLEFIMKLKPVSYNLDISALNSFLHKNTKTYDEIKDNTNEDAQDVKEKEQIVYSGFVAQDVEKAAKEVGYEFSGVDFPKNENDVYALRYADFVVPLVKAVQDLSKENDELKSRLDKLESLLKTITKASSQGVELTSAGNIEQNIPNPFKGNTTISYYLPVNKGTAYISFYASSGELLKSVKLNGTGKGAINLNAAEMPSGAYQYALVIDGKVINTRRMVIGR